MMAEGPIAPVGADGPVDGPFRTGAEDLSRVTQVVLVRHALPLTGVALDPPLAQQGRMQAARAGDWLRGGRA